MIHKNRCNRRWRDRQKAKRKASIIHALNNYFPFKSIHALSKAKVHCSCPLCAAKTSKNGWKPSDTRKLIDLSQQEKEVNYI